MLSKFKMTTLAFLTLMATQNIYAIPTLPGPAQPQQISQALVEQEKTRTIQTPSALSTQPYQPIYSKLPSSTAKLKFRLNDIKIINAKAIPESKLRALYANKLHQTITVAELINIVQSITNYYRSQGYTTSQAVLVPQKASNGIVKIVIIEAYIGGVNVTDHPGKTTPLLRAYGNNIMQQHPINEATLEKYLLLANEIPNTQVQGILTPSRNQFGASDLTMITQHNLMNAYLSYNNYGTRYIGPQQISGNVGLNSFALPGDSAQLTLAKTPKGEELTFIDLNYGLPLGCQGNRFLIGGTSTKTHPLFVLEPFDIDGLNRNYYTTVTFPRLRSATQNLTYLLGFNYNDTRVTTSDIKLYSDNIRSLEAGLVYDSIDRFQGSNSIYADIRQGLPILGHTTNTERATAQTSRPGGTATYTKVDFSISRLQLIKDAFSVYGFLKGQYGFQALLAGEQFAYGGSQLGRGYDIAELLGDKALGGTVELRYDFAFYKCYLQTMQPYAFYDIGKVWNYFSTAGTPTNISATSTGAGIRFVFTKNITGDLWIAKPLTKAVSAESIIGEGHSARGYFSLIASI